MGLEEIQGTGTRGRQPARIREVGIGQRLLHKSRVVTPEVQLFWNTEFVKNASRNGKRETSDQKGDSHSRR